MSNKQKVFAESSVSIYVMSCDKTIDVAQHYIKSLELYWPDCPYRIYFGTNTKYVNTNIDNIYYVKSCISNWKNESIEQLLQIKTISPHTTHLIVFLDDFILRKNVETEKIKKIVNIATRMSIKYLRLKRIEEGVFNLIKQIFIKKIDIGNQKCFKIRNTHPYYSSLQIALWDINYLIEQIKKSHDIWQFENMKSKYEHWSVCKSLIKYRHIVEKGEWEIGAKEYCERKIKYFYPGNRKKRREGIFNYIKYYMKRVWFYLIGYSYMALKEHISKSQIR